MSDRVATPLRTLLRIISTAYPNGGIMKLACRMSSVSTATQLASGTRVRSGGITTGITTNIISNASRTSAQSASAPSTAASAAYVPPPMPVSTAAI